ncbi:hypothetical protein ACFL96_08635 [Thermoproteota archaeon]
MIKIIDLCPVCGGRAKFLNQRCPTCKGVGGKLLKYNKELNDLFDSNKNRLGEQEVVVFKLYRSGLSRKEISKRMDLSSVQTTLILHRIEKKLQK